MDKPDYMSDKEYQDLENMKAEVEKEKIKTYDYMNSVLRYNTTDLEHSGYRNKTRAEAIESILKDSGQRIEKLTQAYIKKYPD